MAEMLGGNSMTETFWESTNFDHFWERTAPLVLANYETQQIPEVFRVTLADLNEFLATVCRLSLLIAKATTDIRLQLMLIPSHIY